MPDGFYFRVGQGSIARSLFAASPIHTDQGGRLYDVPVHAPFEYLRQELPHVGRDRWRTAVYDVIEQFHDLTAFHFFRLELSEGCRDIGV